MKQWSNVCGLNKYKMSLCYVLVVSLLLCFVYVFCCKRVVFARRITILDRICINK